MDGRADARRSGVCVAMLRLGCTKRVVREGDHIMSVCHGLIEATRMNE